MPTFRELFRPLRDLIARPRSEPWTKEDEERWERELQEYEGPIGRENTVSVHGPGVQPEDRAAWEWLGEDPPAGLEAWSHRIQAAMPKLPADSILYDLDAGLGTHDFESHQDERFRAVVKEFHGDVAAAFRRATEPDEWIYAIDEPEASSYYSYRLSPHRVTEDTRWYVSPIPDGDDEYFVSPDFSWGLLGLFGGFPRGDWQVCVFGRRFLDALAENPPRAFNTTIEGDAFSQGDPSETELEAKTSLLMLKVGLNCQLARDSGVWTRDLERRYRKLRRLEEQGAPNATLLESVAGLIARVEAALDKAGVEYEPAMSHFDD